MPPPLLSSESQAVALNYSGSQNVVSASVSSATVQLQPVVKATSKKLVLPPPGFPLQPRQTLPIFSSYQMALQPMQAFAAVQNPLESRQTPPQMLVLSGQVKSLQETAPAQCQQSSPTHKLFDQPLAITNYKLKFHDLLKFEEIAHSKLLKERSVIVMSTNISSSIEFTSVQIIGAYL